MTYDNWKATNPADEFLGPEPPDTCPDCGSEGECKPGCPSRIEPHERAVWPDPTPEMLNGDPLFDAIWNTIKTWDVNVPSVYGGYCGANGNHVRAIYDAVKSFPPHESAVDQERKDIIACIRSTTWGGSEEVVAMIKNRIGKHRSQEASDK